MSFNPSSLPCILSSRDQTEVLAEDREKLRVLQPLQPWFSQEQREELAEVHPWIQQHTIPQEIDTPVGISSHTLSPQTYSSFCSLEHMLNVYLCLTGLCELQCRRRGRPLPSPSCPRQLVSSGEPSAGAHWTSGGHLRDREAKTTNHPAHSEPALPETSTTPTMHLF